MKSSKIFKPILKSGNLTTSKVKPPRYRKTQEDKLSKQLESSNRKQKLSRKTDHQVWITALKSQDSILYNKVAITSIADEEFNFSSSLRLNSRKVKLGCSDKSLPLMRNTSAGVHNISDESLIQGVTEVLKKKNPKRNESTSTIKTSTFAKMNVNDTFINCYRLSRMIINIFKGQRYRQSRTSIQLKEVWYNI